MRLVFTCFGVDTVACQESKSRFLEKDCEIWRIKSLCISVYSEKYVFVCFVFSSDICTIGMKLRFCFTSVLKTVSLIFFLVFVLNIFFINTFKQMEQLNDHTEIIVATLSLKKQTDREQQSDSFC